MIEPLLPSKPRRGGFGLTTGAFWTGFTGVFGPARRGRAFPSATARIRPTTTASSDGAKRAYGTDIFEAVSRAYDGDVQMIDSSSIRVHKHDANGKNGRAPDTAPGA